VKKLNKTDLALFIALVVMMAAILFLTGCDNRDAAAVKQALEDAAAGAAGGSLVGGPWGALIGGGIGLVAGLGKALHTSMQAKRQVGEVVEQRDVILSDVTRGVGDFLDRALDPKEFSGLSTEAVVALARKRLRECLTNAYTDLTRDMVRETKAKSDA
jgi:hypothetical protein